MICIIGGSGFIGTRLCFRLLNSKNLFHIFDKKPCSVSFNNFTLGDIRNPFDLESVSNTKIIINLAAEHRDDVFPSSLYHDVNVNGARNICDFARVRGINKIIFTSSVAVYGFAPAGTDETGKIAPFNEYGRTKWEAEQIYKEWQAESPLSRTLVIIRPTVVFGEGNRGNVFNLFNQISSGKFVMVGDGFNRKSIAYVENVAAFLEYSIDFMPGLHIYNYVDKPDFSMSDLIKIINNILGKSSSTKLRIPFTIGFLIGLFFDFLGKISRKKFLISSIRIKKFCSNSVYDTGLALTGFIPPVPLIDAIKKTISFEFLENHNYREVFYTE